MTDDHAFQAISAYGSDLIETPNIDRLVNEGMLFRRDGVLEIGFLDLGVSGQ